jgi:hypothetical protein
MKHETNQAAAPDAGVGVDVDNDVDSKYQYKRNEEAVRYVEVPLPSGNVFLMEQPSKFSIIFELESLPAALTEKAMEAWQEQGVGNDEGGLQEAGEQFSKTASTEEKLKVIRTGLRLRDMVLRLSHKPKLVIGKAENPGELSTDDVSDDDLAFLFKWAAAGGNASALLASFRNRSAKDPLASAARGGGQPTPQQPGGTPGELRVK